MEDNALETQEQPEVVAEVPTYEEGDTRAVIAEELGKISRDEKGRFAKKEEAESAKEEVPTVEAKEPAKEEPAKAEPPKRNPFSAWKKEAQEKLAALPEDVQQHIIEREGQFHKGLTQYKEEANFGRNIRKALAPYDNYLRQVGATPEQAFTHLISAEKALRTGSPAEKAQMFHKLARDYGVDLGQIAQMPYDHNAYQMQQQLDAIQQQISQSQASQQSAEEVQLAGQIQSFAQSHTHFDDVRGQMADLLDSGFAIDLDDAYEKAVRLNDDVFARINAERNDEAKRQEALKADQAAKAAKAAAVSVKGAPTGVTRNPTPATTEEAVRQAMRQHGIL